MPTLEISITAKQDGVQLPNFPLIRRLTLVETELLNFTQPTGASFVSAPGLPLSSGMAVNALILTADQTVALHMNNQTVGDTGVVLNPGGMIILLDANLTVATLLAIQNNSGSSSIIRGLIGGT